LARVLDPELRTALAERVRFYRELGIYDFYRRDLSPSDATAADSSTAIESGTHESAAPEGALPIESLPGLHFNLQTSMAARKTAFSSGAASISEIGTSKREQGVDDPVAALKIIREDLGDCTRCKLHKLGRKQIVFGVGSPHAELMFVGEGPGADEDAQGEPFVGRAGQLLNNMIKAMGLRR
jgi:uracil-DNA glycosylase